MAILISTQYAENYGSPDAPHWKPKGGYDYLISKVEDAEEVPFAFDAVRGQIEYSNEYSAEYILSYQYVEEGFRFTHEDEEYEEFLNRSLKIIPNPRRALRAMKVMEQLFDD